VAFMRMYGMQGDPGPRPAPRRKSAAAGPRAKAGRKRMVRAQRAARGGNIGASKAPGKKSRGKGFDFGTLARGGLDVAQSFVPGGNIASALGLKASNLVGGGKAERGEGKQRRSTNPANVRALRRSLRRVERFGALVKRVNAMLPRSHKYQVHPVLKHRKRKRTA